MGEVKHWGTTTGWTKRYSDVINEREGGEREQNLIKIVAVVKYGYLHRYKLDSLFSCECLTCNVGNYRLLVYKMFFQVKLLEENCCHLREKLEESKEMVETLEFQVMEYETDVSTTELQW